AGRKLEHPYLYVEANETMLAYGLKGHRHSPEISQEWARAAKAGKKSAPPLIFVPHLAPMNRGIFATLYAPLARKTSAEALREAYQNYYAQEPFVTVLAPYESPEVKAVTYTNACHIGVAVDASGRQAIVMAA